jgi:hypothetical protein
MNFDNIVDNKIFHILYTGVYRHSFLYLNVVEAVIQTSR